MANGSGRWRNSTRTAPHDASRCGQGGHAVLEAHRAVGARRRVHVEVAAHVPRRVEHATQGERELARGAGFDGHDRTGDRVLGTTGGGHSVQAGRERDDPPSARQQHPLHTLRVACQADPLDAHPSRRGRAGRAADHERQLTRLGPLLLHHDVGPGRLGRAVRDGAHRQRDRERDEQEGSGQRTVRERQRSHTTGVQIAGEAPATAARRLAIVLHRFVTRCTPRDAR